MPASVGVLMLGIGALAGVMYSGFLFGLLDLRPPSAHEAGMRYEDLAAIVLSAVSVLVTVLGVIVAILALWGARALRQGATKATVTHITSELQTGNLRRDIEALIASHVHTELETNHALRALIVAQVDLVKLNDAELRAKEGPPVDESTEFGDWK